MPISGLSGAPPGHHRLDPPAEALGDLGLEQRFHDQVHRLVVDRHAARRLFAADRDRAVEQIIGQFALLLDRLDDPRAEYLEQAGYDDHQRRAHFLDVGREFVEALAVIDLRAQPDRKVLPGGMFIGVRERQEGEEHFIVPAEIFRDHRAAALDIVQDRAVMLPHPARGAASAAGVDDARQIVARRVRHHRGRVGRMVGDQLRP